MPALDRGFGQDAARPACGLFQGTLCGTCSERGCIPQVLPEEPGNRVRSSGPCSRTSARRALRSRRRGTRPPSRSARRCSTTSRDSRSTTRGSFAPWITRSGRDRRVDVRPRRALEHGKSRSFTGSPTAMAKYGFHVSGIRSRNVGGRTARTCPRPPTRARDARGERQRHVPAVGPAHHARPRDVHAVVSRQDLSSRARGRAGPARPSRGPPASCRRARSRCCRARWGRRPRTPEREELDERHREPGEVRALLALRTAVHVVDERPRASSRGRGTGGRGAPRRGARRTR